MPLRAIPEKMSPEVIDAIGKWLELAVTVLGAMLFALWAGTIVWTINDMRARSFDLGAIVLAAALAALVPFVGPVVYLLVRPKETLAMSMTEPWKKMLC